MIYPDFSGGFGWGSQTGQSNFTNPFSGQIADVQVYEDALQLEDVAVLADNSSFDIF